MKALRKQRVEHRRSDLRRFNVAADYTNLTAGESEGVPEFKSQEEVDKYITKLEEDMREAAKRFEFEKAAKLRDTIKEMRTKEFLFA